MTTLAHIGPGKPVTVKYVGGERAFRRRLMELGLVPGTRVEIVSVAPLGDPLELLVRGCSLSIRRGEALSVTVDLDADRRRSDAPAEGLGCGTTPCTAAGCGMHPTA